MSNSEKAKQLYLACDNCDPNESTLMPFHLFDDRRGGVYPPMLLGILINKYATEEFEGDWIPFERTTFFARNGEREVWKEYKAAIYRLEKKGRAETKTEDGQSYIRLT